MKNKCKDCTWCDTTEAPVPFALKVYICRYTFRDKELEYVDPEEDCCSKFERIENEQIKSSI